MPAPWARPPLLGCHTPPSQIAPDLAYAIASFPLSDCLFEHLSIPLTLPLFHFKGKEINSPIYLVYNLN